MRSLLFFLFYFICIGPVCLDSQNRSSVPTTPTFVASLNIYNDFLAIIETKINKAEKKKKSKSSKLESSIQTQKKKKKLMEKKEK